MSHRSKNWKIKSRREDSQGERGLSPLILQLLCNRGITNHQAARNFLNPDYSRDLADPYLLPDLKKAVERIFSARKNKERVIVYGDYDVDGTAGCVLLVETLKKLGLKVDYYIPHRSKEGYGLNSKAIQTLGKTADLIVTVDCGISDHQEIEEAKKAKIDVVVTDHHHVPEKLPKAYALVNPQRLDSKYPAKNLSGMGVAFKLAQALYQDPRSKNKIFEGEEKWLLDLVALGTIADLAPLLQENRTLVKFGLVVLGKTPRVGLQKLMQIARVNQHNLDTQAVGYYLAPRLNAAGRIRHANLAFELLTSKDHQNAAILAQELNMVNAERQRLTEKIFKEAIAQIGKVDFEKKILLAKGEWPVGLVGLVAGKVADLYHRPTIVLAKGKDYSTGSARSIERLNIIQALEKCEDLLERFGGHKGAAGLTVASEKIPLLQERLTKYVEFLQPEDLVPEIAIDAEVFSEEISEDFYREIKKLEPFGEANPRPLFLMNNLRVKNIWQVGRDFQHLKMQLTGKSSKLNLKQDFTALAFRQGHKFDKLKAGDSIDVVFELEEDQFNGQKNLILVIKDFKFSL